MFDPIFPILTLHPFVPSGKKKNPSMYRRPSELGMSSTPMEDKTEIRRNFEVKSIGREHIVKHIPDHDVTYHAAVPEWEEEKTKETESKVRRRLIQLLFTLLLQSHYKNLHAKRPICEKIADHMTLGVSCQLEGKVRGAEPVNQLDPDRGGRQTQPRMHFVRARS